MCLSVCVYVYERVYTYAFVCACMRVSVYVS